MPVEGLQRRLQLHGNLQRIEAGGLAAALLRHVLADVLPQIAELGHLAARDVVGHRHPGQLDDAALDRVHQREVAHRPGEERAFRVAGPAQEERRRGQVDHAGEAELASDRLQPGDPEPRGLPVLFRLPAVVARQLAFVVFARLLPVAVMRLVVQREHVSHTHELGHDPLEHLAFAFERAQVGAAALEERAAAPRDLHRLAKLEGVEVGDDDLRAVESAQHVARHQLPALVIAVRVVGLEHAKAVLDRDSGSDDQEAPREPPAVRAANRVDRLPGDEHGHDGGLAGPGGELQGEPGKIGVRFRVCLFEVVEEPSARVAVARGDLGQPDRRLHRLDLAEERPDVVEPMVAPVVQQAGGLRRHPPLALIRQRAPAIDLVPDTVDGLRQFVLLVFGRNPLCFLVEDQRLLSTLTLLYRRDRRDERDVAPPVDDPVGGLPALVELPVLRRVCVRGVEDRAVEELVACFHVDLPSEPGILGASNPAAAGYRRPPDHSRWGTGHDSGPTPCSFPANQQHPIGRRFVHGVPFLLPAIYRARSGGNQPPRSARSSPGQSGNTNGIWRAWSSS